MRTPSRKPAAETAEPTECNFARASSSLWMIAWSPSVSETPPRTEVISGTRALIVEHTPASSVSVRRNTPTSTWVGAPWRDLPISDAALEADLPPYYHPGEDSEEIQYMKERRAALGGLSALVWNGLLFAAGWAVGGEADRFKGLLETYGRVAWVALAAIALVLIIRWWWRKRRRGRA